MRKKSQIVKDVLRCLASYVKEADDQVTFAGCAGCDEQALCHELTKTIKEQVLKIEEGGGR